MRNTIRSLARFVAGVAIATTLALSLGAEASGFALTFQKIELTWTSVDDGGLASGRYQLEPQRPTVPMGQPIVMVLHPVGSSTPEVRLEMHTEGCSSPNKAGAGAGASWSWPTGRPVVVLPLPDGSLMLRIASSESPKCLLAGVIPARRDPAPPGATRPSVGSTDLTDAKPGGSKVPPRDDGDQGPLPAEVGPTLTDLQSGAKRELAAFPSRSEIAGLPDAPLREAALRLRGIVEELALTGTERRSAELCDQYDLALDAVQRAGGGRYHTRCTATATTCVSRCGDGCCCGCGAALVACLAAP